MISKPNFEKLQQALQGTAVTVTQRPNVTGKKKWYHDPTLTTYIATYTNQKEMQKEVQEAGKFGWIPQNTTAKAGHINLGRTALRMGLGASWSKDKTTISFIRQQ